MGDTPTQTYTKIRKTKVEYSASRLLAFSWFKRFSDGEERLDDKEKSGRSRKISSTLATSVKHTIEKDRRQTVRALAEMYDISTGTMFNIVTKD
jgi:transposase